MKIKMADMKFGQLQHNWYQCSLHDPRIYQDQAHDNRQISSKAFKVFLGYTFKVFLGYTLFC